jgi:hypothetical protein
VLCLGAGVGGALVDLVLLLVPHPQILLGLGVPQIGLALDVHALILLGLLVLHSVLPDIGPHSHGLGVLVLRVAGLVLRLLGLGLRGLLRLSLLDGRLLGLRLGLRLGIRRRRLLSSASSGSSLTAGLVECLLLVLSHVGELHLLGLAVRAAGGSAAGLTGLVSLRSLAPLLEHGNSLLSSQRSHGRLRSLTVQLGEPVHEHLSDGLLGAPLLHQPSSLLISRLGGSHQSGLHDVSQDVVEVGRGALLGALRATVLISLGLTPTRLQRTSTPQDAHDVLGHPPLVVCGQALEGRQRLGAGDGSGRSHCASQPNASYEVELKG